MSSAVIPKEQMNGQTTAIVNIVYQQEIGCAFSCTGNGRKHKVGACAPAELIYIFISSSGSSASSASKLATTEVATCSKLVRKGWVACVRMVSENKEVACAWNGCGPHLVIYS